MRFPLRVARSESRQLRLGAVTFLLVGTLGCTAGIGGSRIGSVPGNDGVPIAYETVGDGSVPLVFVHGWMCDRSFWRLQRETFAAGHQVVLIDLGGHGESGRQRGDWTIGSFAEDVMAVLQTLDLENAILVGHSMGGPVIAEVATRTPNRILGLVAVDAYQFLGMPALNGNGVSSIVSPFEEDYEAAALGSVQDMFVETSDPVLAEQITEGMLAGPPEIGIPALRGIFEWYRDEGAAVLGGLTLPIAVINSTEYFPTNLDRLGQLAPSSEVTLMEDLGHFVMIEDAPGFNSLLADAIAEMTGLGG